MTYEDLRKESLEEFRNSWLLVKEKLAIAFSNNDLIKTELMKEAIYLYHSMVAKFAEDNARSFGIDIRPLNDIERLQFITEKVSSRFAFIQLEALFSEAIKKAASQLAMRNR